MDLKKYLKNQLIADIKKYYSRNSTDYILSEEYINNICDSWLNDKKQTISVRRLDIIKKYKPESKNILDMAAGCGTFYFHGLINGFNMHGIEPENWKLELINMKIKENNYPEKWGFNIKKSFGEKLPYEDNYFDFISSYQTLEHVNNIKKCLNEMIRTAKKNSCIHIQCPDYNSTFEGHYKIPWFLFFSKFPNLTKFYLRLLKRPTLGLNTFNYITLKKVIKILKKNHNNKIIIIDLNKQKFINKYKIKYFYKLYRLIKNMKIIFRKEFSINIIIIKKY